MSATDVDYEKEMKKWDLLKNEEDRRFFDKVNKMIFADKVATYGNDFVDIVRNLYSDFFKLTLKNESDVKKFVSTLAREKQILAVNTYLKMKVGKKRLGMK